MKKGKCIVFKMVVSGRHKGQVRKELMDWVPEVGVTYFGAWKALLVEEVTK